LEKNPADRSRLWKDLIESKKSFTAFKNCTGYQERRIYELDKDFYERKLQEYVK
jgi:hypothetical protein